MTIKKFPLKGTFLSGLGNAGMGSIPQGNLSFRHSEQRSNAERDSEAPALGWDFAPSLTWGRLGWGVARKGFFSSLRLEAMRERKQTKPVRWRKTMSFPTARIIQIRHGVPFINCQCVTPAHEPESPSSREDFKIIQPRAIRSTMRL